MIEVTYKDDLRKLFWREYDGLRFTNWEDVNIEDIIKCYNTWGKTRQSCYMKFNGIEYPFVIDPIKVNEFRIFICSECNHKVPIHTMLNDKYFPKFCPHCGSKIENME